MKLLLLTGYFPNSVDPERGVFNLQQARALARYCEVRVMAPVQWFPFRLWHGAGPSHAPAREVIEGLPAWHPRYVLTPGVARAAYAAQMAAAVVPAVGRARRGYPFDVILATWAFPDVVVGALCSRLWNVPLLAKVHGSDINVQARYPLRRAQIRWALDRAHRVLAVSGALRERLLEIGVPREKILVRHNGVDGERFRPGDREAARRALGIPTRGRHVLFVGWFVEAKAVHVLVEAAARLRERGALSFTTHLVGDGPLAASLRARAEQRGVASAFRFHGVRPHAEIPLWMQAADLLCLPSAREGCPNVVLEALASGRPVVATRVGGVPELLDEESAVLIPPGDPEALASGLLEALLRRWDAGALRKAAAAFSWDAGARALHEAAREACAARLPDASRAAAGFTPRAGR